MATLRVWYLILLRTVIPQKTIMNCMTPSLSPTINSNNCPYLIGQKLRNLDGMQHQKTACANKEAGKIAEDLNISMIQDLNTLYYTVAITVSPPKPESDNPVPKEPALTYKEKLEKRVKFARKLVGQLMDLKKKGNPDPNHHLLKGKDVFEALTTAHMRLAHKAFYYSLQTTSQTVEDPPTQEAISSFWGKLFGREGTHQGDAPLQVEDAKGVDAVKEGSWKDITTDELHKMIQKLKNWKAPGLMESTTTGTNILLHCI
eukprot:15364882-Ditylum_brightwellii.AAC.1